MSERVEISKKLVLINAASAVLTRLLSLAVIFWLQQYLLNRVSYDEYSLQPLLYSVMMFAPLFTVILTGGLGRFITVAYARDDDEEVTRICSTMFPILCVAAVLFLALGWTFAWYSDRLLNIAPELVWDARIMLGLLFFSVAIRLPLLPFGTGFFVRQKFALFNGITFLSTILRHAILLTLLFTVSTRLLWVIIATVIADMVQLAIVTPLSMRMLPALRVRRKNFHWPIAREVSSFGGWQFSMMIGNTLRTALDPIVLNLYATSWDLACYHLASLPFQTIWQLISMAKGNLNPSLTAMHAAGAQDRLRGAFLRGNRLALWLFLMPSLPLALFAQPIMDLYVGPDQWLAALLLQANFLAMLTMIPSLMFSSIAEATGKLREFCLLVLFANVVNLGLTFVFVAYLGFGAIGSCLATGVASAIFYPLFIWPLSRKTLGTTFREWSVEVMWFGILPSLCSAPVYLLGSYLIAPGSWFQLGLFLALGGIVYVISLYSLAARARDREDISRSIEMACVRIKRIF